jgi:hypothetical protein
MLKEVTLKTWRDEKGQLLCAFKQDDMSYPELAQAILELEDMLNKIKTKYLTRGVAFKQDYGN